MPLLTRISFWTPWRGIQKANNDTVEYFKPLAFSSIETENVIEEKVNKETGEAIYKRADSSKDANYSL